MGKWWDRDPRDMTPLEFANSPISVARINSIRHNRPRAYQYYDTPDGQDCWKKMWVVTKWGLGTGSFLGLIDVRMYSNPTTVFQALNRFAYWVVPFTGMFTTYGALTYTLTNLRGKDDPLNSGLAGLAAGSLAGVWLKSGQIGGFTALFVGLFCAARKHGEQVGHKMFNPVNISQMYGDHRTIHWDSSLTPVGNRGWTTGAE